jgi:hypothetical protein
MGGKGIVITLSLTTHLLFMNTINMFQIKVIYNTLLKGNFPNFINIRKY